MRYFFEEYTQNLQKGFHTFIQFNIYSFIMKISESLPCYEVFYDMK